MLTFLLLIVLAIMLYFLVKKFMRQKFIINELRNELVRLKKVEAKLKKNR